jgi:hypothetical protein
MRRLRLLVLLSSMIAACVDLPDGWEDARPVDELRQAACAGSPYEGYDERVEGSLDASPLNIAVRESSFRCEQDVEGFYRVRGGTLDLLIQPIDMNPNVVAGCDCLYDIEMSIALEVDLAPSAASVYRRWDNLNEPNDPVLVGTLTRD